MNTNDNDRLQAIKDFSELVGYLRDELDWPIKDADFDDLTFDYEPQELGIDAKTAAKIEHIKQLRKLEERQPWGIFFIEFEPKRLPVVAQRRLLNRVVVKKRDSATALTEQPGRCMTCSLYPISAREILVKSASLILQKIKPWAIWPR
jgi:hypothetical protein